MECEHASPGRCKTPARRRSQAWLAPEMQTEDCTEKGPSEGACEAKKGGAYEEGKPWNTCAIRSTARSMSERVVRAPKLSRMAPSTRALSSRIAMSTGEGSLEPLAQADPVEHATPAKSRAIASD